MKKGYRSTACLILVLSLALASLTGCSLFTNNKPAEATVPTPTDDRPATQPTQSVQVEDAGLQPLRLALGNRYLSEWTDNYVQLGHVSWLDLVLEQESAAEYPALAQALMDVNQQSNEWAEDTLAEMLPYAREQASYMGTDFYGFYHEAVVQVQRADDRILSVRSDYNAYTGGVRPYYGTTVLNLDTATGQALPLSQVLPDWQQLPGILEEALLKKYPDLAQGAFDDLETMFSKYSQEDYTWTVDYQGITFYFGLADIAPAVAGCLSATVWFDEYPDLFPAELKETPPQGYVRKLSDAGYNDVDLTPGDGRKDTLYVSANYEQGLFIEKNGVTLANAQGRCYDAQSYLVTPDNQHFYLYVATSTDNDYSILWVYDVSGENFQLVESLQGENFASYLDEGYFLGVALFNQVFTDPEQFTLSTRMDILGTHSGSRSYHVDPDTGMPVPDEDYYTLMSDRPPLVTKIPLKVRLLPRQMEIEIPAGTNLWFLRSDGETFVDMRMEDGKQCRIYVTRQNWPSLVNGIPEDECFDGLMYAG